MTVRLSATTNIENVIKSLNSTAKKQVPFALARALTDTGRELKASEVREMKNVFDRPTPWTLNSLFLKPARKDDLESVVWLRDYAAKGTPATKYLAPQIFGGDRNYKRSERLLQARGLLPAGYWVVPGSGARKDRYGNIGRGQMQKILSNLRAQFDTWQNTPDRSGLRAAANPSGGDYFVGRPGGGKLPLGVWQRLRTKIKPVLIFTQDKPSYSQTFDFFDVADTVSDRVLVRNFNRRMDQALRTAR